MKSLKLVIILLLVFCTSACTKKEIDYQVNLGLDAKQIEVKQMVFRVYHVNEKTHYLEEIHHFRLAPSMFDYLDVNVTFSKETVHIMFVNQWLEKRPEVHIYHSLTLNEFDYQIKDFEGQIPGQERREISDNYDEQLFKLFPINNDGTAPFYVNIPLDKPYDLEPGQLDVILITVQFEQ